MPLLLLISMSLVLIIGTFLIDKQLDGKAINAYLSNLLSDDAGTLANVLGGLTQVAPAILGIAITVIAIIVEMASNKYSPKVMDLFVKDPLNFWIMALFVVTSVNSIWVAHILTNTFFPIVSIGVNGILVCFSLILVIPYFNHIFNFLHPNNFITYVKNRAINNLELLSKAGKNSAKVDQLKIKIHEDIDFIGDIAINSVIEGDRAVSSFCSNILRELCTSYLDVKNSLPESYFELTEIEIEDPDFIDFSDFVINSLRTRKVWFERKIFRLMELIFNVARDNLRPVASGVLLNTYKIGERACLKKQAEVVFTTIQYFNTFLRFAINNSDPRTAFNILEHYRNFGEILIQEGSSEVETVVFCFKYYALEAQKRHVLFILETVAHDLCYLNEIAYSLNSPTQLNLLNQFLKLDQPIDESAEGAAQQEMSLLGVRLAQAKLAGFYIMKERLDLAKLIYHDMREEPKQRINKLREIIDMNGREEYWEITGRGVNFFYVSPERREALKQFFTWFEENNIH